jgi:tRNA-specific 2-thiouridylase
LALGTPAADGAPRYVTSIDVKSRTVKVGPPRLLEVNFVEGVRPTWINTPVAAGAEVGVQWRAHGIEVRARIEEVTDSTLSFTTEEPIRGVAPGQQAVFYIGEQVIGSVMIQSSARRENAIQA